MTDPQSARCRLEVAGPAARPPADGEHLSPDEITAVNAALRTVLDL